ncbi:DUF2177 family protein [Albimonas sp. CAU 1670]|uniref:DUF2177 family protein n=1 Tax=Albimonas sp. CAU 1670 TaxID=3032599 RepID=UPI0023DB8E5A|nr:DUF2177 family protein [Albimonas sp. CAU 1670]MDF2234882.1 DUF2177 family protein [Albimonas sp. CAU 1670]
MTLGALYLATFAVFLALDALMLTRVMKPLFDRHYGAIMLEDPKFAVAGVFYLGYVAGILWFASWPALAPEGGGWRSAALNGAILGLLAYATYEFVNMATLKGWSWQTVILDTIWGGVLTAASAAAGVAIIQALGMARS